MAAIEYRGLNAVTNFDLSRYIKWLKPNTTTSTTTYNNISGNFSLPNPTNTEANVPQNFNQDDDQLGLGNFFHDVQHITCNVVGENLLSSSPQPRPATATSALGLLLQSSKFKEMMEMTSAGADCALSSPPPPLLPELDDQPLGCAFPEDIRTYFDDNRCQDSSSFADGDDSIFSELNSFMQPMFPCDFDTN